MTAQMRILARTNHGRSFYGWRVVGAAFVLAVFGWGMGFYGPPVYLHAVREARGWSLFLVSTAVTLHFLIGALVGANLPLLYRRFGLPTVTKAGALAMALGVFGWACVTAPWQLLAAALLSGAGWAAMSAAAINAIVSPWFVRGRPAALGMAYNGGSVGGVVFSPLWVAAVGWLGFQVAAAAIGLVMAIIVWALAGGIFARTPQQMGLAPDGDAPGTPAADVTSPAARPLPGALLWQDLRFVTLAAGMGLGLFAQIGLIAHLFSLLVPALGAQQAGLAMGLATASAIAGRTLVGWMMPAGAFSGKVDAGFPQKMRPLKDSRADRRLVACVSYVIQIAGSIAFMMAAGTSVPLLLVGVVLFGAGIGNATSLPPLIAQVEFVKDDVQRAVALIVGIGQGTYAFAPAAFGLIRELAPHAANSAPDAAPLFFAATALVQGLAICAFLAGRRG
jgi:MFS family permease